MRRRGSFIALAIITAGVGLAQNGHQNGVVGENVAGAAPLAESEIAQQVRQELLRLPYYGVFDNLAYRLDGDTVTLYGEVIRPELGADAGNVVQDIEGVRYVFNNIQVLPLSPDDDRIRIAVYRAIYGQPSAERYALQAVPPIHIIVANGHVMLDGVVSSKMDKNLANIQAHQVPGVSSVTNNLQVAAD